MLLAIKITSYSSKYNFLMMDRTDSDDTAQKIKTIFGFKELKKMIVISYTLFINVICNFKTLST